MTITLYCNSDIKFVIFTFRGPIVCVRPSSPFNKLSVSFFFANRFVLIFSFLPFKNVGILLTFYSAIKSKSNGREHLKKAIIDLCGHYICTLCIVFFHQGEPRTVKCSENLLKIIAINKMHHDYTWRYEQNYKARPKPRKIYKYSFGIMEVLRRT